MSQRGVSPQDLKDLADEFGESLVDVYLTEKHNALGAGESPERAEALAVVETALVAAGLVVSRFARSS